MRRTDDGIDPLEVTAGRNLQDQISKPVGERNLHHLYKTFANA